jgi:ATP-binding cassette subfamily D (ALD) long-chain fatty acid import protein
MRPLFDAAYCTVLLVQVKLPPSAIIAMWAYGIFGIGMIKMFAPDFGHFISEGERLEGEFRSSHARVRSNAEAIAFAGGSDAEKAIVTVKIETLINQAHTKNNARGAWRPIESFVLYRIPEFVTQVCTHSNLQR